jgi:hypothetical protein
MKKKTAKNLALRFQTVRVLVNEALVRAAGGNPEPIENGFIMRDTVIVPTNRR